MHTAMHSHINCYLHASYLSGMFSKPRNNVVQHKRIWQLSQWFKLFLDPCLLLLFHLYYPLCTVYVITVYINLFYVRTWKSRSCNKVFIFFISLSGKWFGSCQLLRCKWCVAWLVNKLLVTLAVSSDSFLFLFLHVENASALDQWLVSSVFTPWVIKDTVVTYDFYVFWPLSSLIWSTVLQT